MRETPPANDTLADRTAAGAAWVLGGRGLAQVIGLAISMVLLRFLVPADKGLIGMVMVFVYILSDVRDLRFSDALIQRGDLTEEHRRSAFCVQAGAGFALSAGLALFAPLVAQFYQQPILLWVTVVLALKPFLESLADVPLALLARRMEFKKIATADVVSLAGSGALAVVLAVKGWGPWALVALNVGGSMIRSGMVMVSARWVPIPRPDLTRLRELWRFSAYLYGARLLGQLARNGDKLLVGKWLGSAALGLYGLGFQLMMLPIEQIAWVVNRVMFAALSEIQDDLERLRNAYLRAVRLLSLITFPVTIGLCVTAAELVHAIMRPEWADGVPVIRIFCVVGFFESVGTTVGWIFFSLGRTRREFAWMAVQLGATIAAVLVGLRFGIVGVAAAYLVRTLVLLIPSFVVAFRLIGLRVGVLLRWLAPTAGAAGIMGLAVWSLRAVLMVHFALPAWAMLIAEVAWGAAVYAACIWTIGSEVWAEAFGLLRGFLRGRGAAR